MRQKCALLSCCVEDNYLTHSHFQLIKGQHKTFWFIKWTQWFVKCGQAAIYLCHVSFFKKINLSFSLGGLLHWGAPVLPVPATHQRDNAKDEQHLDWSHRYSQAPHLLLLLPEPDQVRTSSKTEVDKWFHQVCSTWPPAHAPPHHPQHKSLLCDPGKSRLWKFKVKSFCTHKGNA